MRTDLAIDRKPLHPLTVAIALCAAIAAAAAPPAVASCESSVALTVNETRRDSGPELLEVTLGVPGVLTLDVSSPADGVQPRIEFLGTTSDCLAAAGEGVDFEYVQERPKWVAVRILATSSTTYYLNVTRQDSKQQLGAYKLRATWIADATSYDEWTDLDPDATDTCNSSSSSVTAGELQNHRYVVVTDSTGQWDPDIMQIAVGVPGIVLIENDDTAGPDLEATLYPTISCASGSELGDAVLAGGGGRIAAVVHEGDHALELNAHDSSSGTYEVAVRFYAPCGVHDTDDHGSAARCATPIGLDDPLSGEIANGDDDDEDWFTLVLAAQRTVGIETVGSTDTLGSLYDAAGQRLEVQDGGGAADNFRIARTLGPGRYYVRVEGAGGDEGSYTLEVEEEP